jgi:ribosome modulation factor
MSETDTKIARIPRDTKARREGYLAGRRGRTGAANPYRGDSRAAREWLMGLLDGRARRLKTVEGG